ncbi:MAG TPA: class I SAM-dependent methyltransferase [Segetibacter sp.]|jgi:SAM-dependent methyltransferase
MGSDINYDHCLCCGSVVISKVLSCKDYTVSQQLFEVWQCSNCSFRFTQNSPDAAGIGPYYQSTEYISHSDSKEGLVNKLYHLVRNYTLTSKLNLVKKVTGLKQGALLDVGAGTGAFAKTMQSAGWDVTGLEPDATARANALSNYNLNLQDSEALKDLEANNFDAITMWHVLEHVHDLHGYLEKYLHILKRAGRLIIAVPNYTSYDAKTYKESWAAYDVPRHLYHFSPKSMETLLERKGFVLEAVKPMWFDSFYVSMLSEKYKSGTNNYGSAFFTGLISNLKAIRDTKKCSSVIYIIRKKPQP